MSPSLPLHWLRVLFCALLGWSAAAMALDRDEIARRIANLDYQTGSVVLPRANATLEVPPGWKFLSVESIAELYDYSREDVRRVDGLGLLMPATMNPFAKGAWYVTLSNFGGGYISMDLGRIEPYALTWRTRDVYSWAGRLSGGWRFVNFARAPQVDSAKAIVLWSERVLYPQDDGAELLSIYGMALNRSGGMIAQVDYMPNEWQDAVEAAVEQLIRSVRYNVGQRYEDHNPADPVADYELSHIITGEYWLGPQTWSAWLQEPVRIDLGKMLGGKKFKINVPNWAFWGSVILVFGLTVVRWIRGSGRARKRAAAGRGGLR